MLCGAYKKHEDVDQASDFESQLKDHNVVSAYLALIKVQYSVNAVVERLIAGNPSILILS